MSEITQMFLDKIVGVSILVIGVAFIYFIINKIATTKIIINKTKVLSILTALIMLFMLLFPPYKIIGYKHLVKETGYAAIYNISDIEYGSYAATINIPLLITQESIIFIVYLVLFLLIYQRNNINTEKV